MTRKNLPNVEVIPEIKIKLIGEDISSKLITLQSGDDTYSATTGSAGGCTVKNIKAGQYDVTIDDAVVDTIIVSSENTEFEITIE